VIRILTVSDVVSNSLYNSNAKERFSGIDLILGCGDLPAYYLEFLVSMFDVPLYYILGNHADELATGRSTLVDHARLPHQWRPMPSSLGPTLTPDADGPAGPHGCINIDGRTVFANGLIIAGLQGSMWYNGGPYQYTEDQMQRKTLLLQTQLVLNRLRYGRALDILITHAPPAGIHDDVDQAHRGFKIFLKLMDDYAPRYLIHGHKHVYLHGEATTTQYNHTTVINSYGFRRLELEVAKK
jgi:uncharacterized protein